MYDHLTDRARKVLKLANEEAKRFHHEYIGTEHLLLGLVEEGAGIAAQVLMSFDLDLRKIRLEVEKIIQSGPGPVQLDALPQTPRTRKAIEYALAEARELRHTYVGTEHLLLGLLREEEGVAAQILMNLGVFLKSVRSKVLQLLGHDIKLPETDEVEALDIQIEELERDKEEYIAEQRFDMADQLRDQIDALNNKRQELIEARNRKRAIARKQETDLSSLPLETQQEIREIDAQIERLNKEKEDAIAVQDFEKAAYNRDAANKLHKTKKRLIRRAKRGSPGDTREYELLVPTRYPDGTFVDESKLLVIKHRLQCRFEFCHFMRQQVLGSFEVGSAVFREELASFRIVAEDIEQPRDFFQQLKAELKRDMQLEIAVIVRKVEII